MNIKNLTVICLILVAHVFNMYAMENPPHDATEKDIKDEFVNTVQNSEFHNISQTPKFQALLQKPEFWAIALTPQFQNFVAAINTNSQSCIQEALEDILETEALQLLFKAEIFSEDIVAKYNAMKETDAYTEYQNAKQYCIEGCLTQEIVDDYKITWRNTKEYNDLVDATNQEMLFTNDNTNAHDFSDMEGTELYRSYQRIKQFHEKHNTPQTEIVMQQALYLLLEAQAAQRAHKVKVQESYEKAQELHATYNTPQTQAIMQEGLQLILDAKKSNVTHNNSQIYSNNVVTKNLILQQSPLYQQYQAAKLAYEQNPSADTQYMLELCKAELLNTKECQAFIAATDKEQHITHNIVNSQQWQNEQPLSWQSADALIAARNNAWIAVQQTKEYQRFQQAKLDHEKYNNDDTLFLRNEHQRLAKETPEYKQYNELEQTRLVMIEQLPKNDNDVIKAQFCSNNSNDDNNTTTASSTTQPQIIETFSAQVLDIYHTLKQTPVYIGYQESKQEHAQYNTNATQSMMYSSLAHIMITKEWDVLLTAIHKEKDALNKIIQSEPWVTKQKYLKFPLLVENKDINICPLQTKLIEFLCNKLETQLSPHQQHKKTNNNNFGITIQPYTKTSSDCCITHEGPKIDIQLTSPNNNYSPRATCVPHNLQLELSNNNPNKK